MSFYEDLKEGLLQAIEYEKGNLEVNTITLTTEENENNSSETEKS